ncbi:MAG TPA: amidase family protein, partial [Tepidisphaeraceae bacterium]|nr:amidase family protein [Tepidisphaeraceae bacterium]
MNRRDLLRLAAVGGVASVLSSGCTKYMRQSSERARSDVEEADIARLSRSSSVALTQEYLERIGKIDKSGPALNSIIEVNPDALADARKLDDERKAKGPRGPLHGIPV